MILGKPGENRWDTFEEVSSFRNYCNKHQALQTSEASDHLASFLCKDVR